MEDHHSFYDICNANPSLENVFGPGEQSLAPNGGNYPDAQLTDLPTPVVGGDIQDGVSDLDEYQSLWLLLREPDHPTTVGDNCDSYFQGPQSSNVEVVGDYDFRNGPAPPAPPLFDCSCCQVLRQITHLHYEYNTYMKLEIHGTLGVISHVIAERKIGNMVNDNTSSGDTLFEMLDFSSKGTEEVKQFLTSYCLQRSEEGYVMSVDPLVIFYEALCVGQPTPQILGANDFLVNLQENKISGGGEYTLGESNHHIMELQEHEQAQATQLAIGRRRRAVNPNLSLSEQRQKTSKLKLSDLREVFHLALNEAAKRMEVCATVIKKICRRHGVRRWPYRKIERDKKRIANLEQKLNSRHDEIRAEAQAEIDRLRQDIIVACGGINIF